MSYPERREIEAAYFRLAQLDELRADLNIEAVSYGGERVSAMIVGTIAGAVAYVGTIDFRRARS